METIIKIIAEPQKDPGRCKFILEIPLSIKGSYVFRDKKEIIGSKLAELIFQVEGVTEVFIAPTVILVTMKEPTDWHLHGKNFGLAIREAISSGVPLISEEMIQKIPATAEVKKQVEKLIKEQINPSLASHGGYIELLDVRNNDIFIKMGGGCHGCAMSQATLKQGIEQTLRQEMPFLGSIYDTTDHAAGLNPYYNPEAS